MIRNDWYKAMIDWHLVTNVGILQKLRSPIIDTNSSDLLPFNGGEVRVNRQIALIV